MLEKIKDVASWMRDVYLQQETTIVNEDKLTPGSMVFYSGESRTFEQLRDNVITWAEERGILSAKSVESQLLKTVEELGELAGAVVRDTTPYQKIDALGDVMVTLIIVAEMLDLDIVTCLDSAYEVIARRKGKMVGGVFVKEEDLPVDEESGV